MAFRLSNRSLTVLGTVDPRLQKVVKLAILKTKVDFTVTQGLRTLDEQARLFGKGRTAAQMTANGLPKHYAQPNEKKVTWTMKSNHMTGRAVDLAAYVNGTISWDTTKGYYQEIARAMKEAAQELGVKIVWGGDWKSTIDLPHYELVD